MTEINDESVPDETEQLDQLEPDRSLVDRGVDDPLDEGYVPPDRWSAAEGFGNTAAEMREGESLEQRLKQEVPDIGDDAPERPGAPVDPDPSDDRVDPDELDEGQDFLDDAEVGDRRAGRLAEPAGSPMGADTEAALVAEDIGIDGAAASAEEAAVHVVDESEADRA